MDKQYFSRSATWTRSGEQLTIHDSFSPKAPRMITMERWHEVVFLAADGQHTVDEFVEHMAAQYADGSPPGLREQIHQVISDLLAEHVIRLHDDAQELPPYFHEEYFAQPPEVRKQQMQSDGLIPPD